MKICQFKSWNLSKKKKPPRAQIFRLFLRNSEKKIRAKNSVCNTMKYLSDRQVIAKNTDNNNKKMHANLRKLWSDWKNCQTILIPKTDKFLSLKILAYYCSLVRLTSYMKTAWKKIQLAIHWWLTTRNLILSNTLQKLKLQNALK